MDSLSLLDVSGYIVVAVIVAVFAGALVASFAVQSQYKSLERALSREPVDLASHPLIAMVDRECRAVAAQGGASHNAQAIVEHCFQSGLPRCLLAERFVRSAAGLMIVLGLIGTFYGLTLSIGKLVHLVTSEAASGGEVAQAVTQGLSQALSGMSVAFTTSLFGIGGATFMMFFSVFWNVTDQRTSLMIRLENYAERALAAGPTAGPKEQRLELALDGFARSLVRLEEVVVRFDGALQNFTVSTRDFQQFNHHLKDNVQRMSLSFGDFSETLKTQIGELKAGRGS